MSINMSMGNFHCSHSYLLLSLLYANESRLSAAGRALPSYSLWSNRSQPRWQSLARPWKSAYSTKGKDDVVKDLAPPTS